MPSKSMFNRAEKITCLRHVDFNPLLLGRSALDLLHLTKNNLNRCSKSEFSKGGF